VVLGLFLVVLGVSLLAAPLAAARFAARLRFAPYSTHASMVRYYRACGVAFVVLGVVSAIVLS
jgi:hypothetical protein